MLTGGAPVLHVGACAIASSPAGGLIFRPGRALFQMEEQGRKVYKSQPFHPTSLYDTGITHPRQIKHIWTVGGGSG